MVIFRKQSGIGLVFACAFALAACGGSGSGVGVSDGGTDGSSQPPPSGGTTGFLNLSVSDAPIKDATKVCIRFDGVELKHADSDEKEMIDFDQPVVVNLLTNQGAQSTPIVTGAEVPAGEYEWIRLKVQAERDMSGGSNDGDPTSEACDDATDNSYLVRNSGGVFNLYIPSGSQRGLQLIKDIIIPVNRSGDYTAEWDLGKSFNGPPGQLPDVMMKPVVKLVANNEVGTLDGQVDERLVEELPSCDADFAPSVYVFDDGVEPNPLDDPLAVDDAVATALVERQMQEDGSMPYRYEVGFLLPGPYEVAYTCNGTDFVPLAGKPAEIFVDQITTVDFDFADAPGTLAGLVDGVFFDPEAPESGFCDAAFPPTVYVFEDGVAPSFDDAIATGEVTAEMQADESMLYSYSIALQAADYNTAFSCTGTDFIPEAGKPAQILPAEVTTVDFLASDAPPPVGSLSGTVASELAEADTCDAAFTPAVYVFDGGVTPSDTETPVTTGEVTGELQSDESTLYSYSIDSLVADTYSAAFTCTGTDFVPVAGKEAVITIGNDTPLDFVAGDAPAP